MSERLCLIASIYWYHRCFLCLPSQSSKADLLDTMCSGCADVTCKNCQLGGGGGQVMVPICTEVMPHTNSAGGEVTVETLSVSPGYWRATPSSRDVLACYNPDACRGGMTGSARYCLEGYEGPCEYPVLLYDWALDFKTDHSGEDQPTLLARAMSWYFHKEAVCFHPKLTLTCQFLFQ